MEESVNIPGFVAETPKWFEQWIQTKPKEIRNMEPELTKQKTSLQVHVIQKTCLGDEVFRLGTSPPTTKTKLTQTWACPLLRVSLERR